ncbi:DUF2500 family protein [Kamptonema cortianum]|nr:DUF2500 family protein [Geitlerinema splendidum]MDK3160340.1 DUF2500 family protein [Kamptonema cortianum]
MNSRQQIQVIGLCVLGAGLLVITVLAFVFGAAADARYVDVENRAQSLWVALGVPAIFFAGSVASFIAAFVIGSRTAWQQDSKAPLTRIPNVYVVAKLAESKDGHVFDLDMHDPSELKYFVQVKFENGESQEYRTSAAVYSSIGEGMRGTIFVQGTWLAAFELSMGTAESVASYSAH